LIHRIGAGFVHYLTHCFVHGQGIVNCRVQRWQV
jgi:hypothetical protein